MNTKKAQPTSQQRIILVDAVPVVRVGLQQVLSAVEGFDVVGAASDITEALALVSRVQPDLAIVDPVKRSEANGEPRFMDWLAEARRRMPAIRVVVFSLEMRAEYIRRLVKPGVAAFFSKWDEVQALPQAIGSFLDNPQEVVLSETVRHSSLRNPTNTVYKELAEFDLSRRETQIIHLVINGRTSKEIARELGISETTVAAHRSSVLMKTGSKSFMQLIGRLARNSTTPM